MSSQPFVIIGASLTGASAAAQLRDEGFEGDIVLVGEEPHRPYERPPLSKEYLRGEVTAESFEALHAETDADADTGADADAYAARGIDLRSGTRAEAIDPAAHTVTLADGSQLRYERLLLATGSAPRHLDVPGHDLGGIHYLRTLEDADALRDTARSGGEAVVIGAGWIGTEVAASLRQLGVGVTLVAPTALPLAVLGDAVGTVYRDLHLEHGVTWLPGRSVVALHGAQRVKEVETDDGRRIPADLVVVGIGVRPRTELAAAAGLVVRSGVDVDETLAASAPDVFAAGDVAAAWHPRLGIRLRVEHWDNARRQGRHAAGSMLGSAAPYTRLPYFFSDQYDLSVEVRGHVPKGAEVVVRGRPEARQFVAFWLRDGRVLAGMNAGVERVGKAITALVESDRAIDPERLADGSIPLEDIDALALERTREAGVGSAAGGGPG